MKHTLPCALDWRRWLLLTSLITVFATIASAQSSKPPVLISETTSTRAIAFDSVSFKREPFSLGSLFATDGRTRVILFALNINLAPNEDLSIFSADAETATHDHRALRVEYVAPVPGLQWLSAVTLRLSDDLPTSGDVLVSLTLRGVKSNRVRVGIGSVGGGPPDDAGAMPTPAPPYQLAGRVTTGNQGLAGVNLLLSGDQTGEFTTDGDGFYSILINSFGDYTLTASKQLFDIISPVRVFPNLSGNQLSINFSARHLYSVSGQIVDDGGQPLPGITVVLTDSNQTTVGTSTTSATGAFFFEGVPSGSSDLVTPSSTPVFAFNALTATVSDNDVVVNFTGVRRVYSISGTVKSNTNEACADVPVALHGFQTTTAFTASDGSFSFSNLPAGRDYNVSIDSNAFYIFTAQQNFSNLSQNSNAAFVRTPRQYSISGHVDLGGSPYANEPVRIAGGQVAVTTTDVNGNFGFSGLNAASTYFVSPDPTTLRSFPTQTVPILGADKFLNFVDVPRKYSISGSIKDLSGNPIVGALVNLAGTETATTRSNIFGQYTIAATVLGSYTISADIEQHYYSFAPSTQTLNSLVGDQTKDFTATLSPLPNPSQVLEFDGTPKSVDYGNFWPAFTNLGHFFWEFWAMPGNNAGATYLLSDGYGGLHALLFGFANFNTSETNRYQLLGNMSDGSLDASHLVYFGSDQGPAPGEWGHFAVGWDGQNILTYMNGVPIGRTAYTRVRQSVGPGQGSGRLLIGGSDHSNFQGRIAEVRGFEGSNPRESSSVESAFAPQTVFAPDGNLLSWYFTPAPYVADLSRGYITGAHIGWPRSTLNGVLGQCDGCPTPQFVYDSTAPNFVTNTPAQPASAPTPPPTPANALVFDSFSRANSTYVFGAKGGLGSTESGSSGVQIWQMNQDQNQLRPFGILNGVGVVLADSAAMTWVSTGSNTANLQIQVDRNPGRAGSGVSTGLSFRVKDANNYFFAYTSGNQISQATQTLTVGYYLEGVRTTIASQLPMPDTWTRLTVVTLSSGSFKVIADSTIVFSGTELVLSSETTAGLYSNDRGMGLVNRWDNFAVFSVN
ncbi:MAG TPA: carboxypeptidase regulatory-like domain-containing protein [Pyrinomonadaceae bacterium]